MKPRLPLMIAAALLATLAPPALAVDTQSSTGAPDLSAPRAKIEAKNWAGAIEDLRKIAETATHADVYSLLGYSLRKSGKIAEAKVYYAKALDFDPKHKGAREYLGELYVAVSDMPKAKEQLAILETLCPNGCEELEDLKKDIASAGAAAKAD